MNALTYSTALASGRVQLANVRQRSLLVAQVRLLVVLLLFALAAVACVMRIVMLGVVEPAPRSSSLYEALLPSRGEIVDRNGVALARAFPAYALWYNPQALGSGTPLVKSPGEVAHALALVFPDADEADLLRRLKAGKPGYLHRRVLPEQANRIHALGEPALEFPREPDRFYPQGSLAAHVLGFVAADGHGRVGMEQVFDKQLTDPALRARPEMLSLDMRVQGALEDELSRGMLETDAIGAAGVVLDVDSGEILALASLPSFNPNRPDQAVNRLVFNKVTNQVYELGSTFKPITVAAAIDAGTITNLAKRYSAAPIQIDGFTIKDSHNMGASLNAPEALIHSSNIVTAHIADELGADRLKATMIALGMNERPYLELPGRGFPLFPRDPKWARITNMTVSYGHGIAVTPLHLASAYAALVNGGIWRPATLQMLEPGQAPRGRRVFKASTSARMRQLLRMIAVYGTGRKANAAGFRVGGKTGSAEKPGANGGAYKKNAVVATFAAAFPMDRPRYVIIAMLDEPKGTAAASGQRTAAWNAAPVVGRVVPRIGPLLGVVPDDSRDIDLTDLAPLIPHGGGE
ncbi:penicillin-binding protein 2 [Novosphingobium sp. Gsoil 351]|uniref:peptidoglycan D,D-transpeptidase FtsI family protein n=1 Tax=Novosphingobium sp. Gsoil 351 TaxID=2675225 RepID=UPI0012B4D320|nr:penicillin-binding protein 2 [Novosphingobium sp. Gsoil 351]QGN55568.1 penicillin-binding protein 2 [Novosphingobium sp. Gsoil 351]